MVLHSALVVVALAGTVVAGGLAGTVAVVAVVPGSIVAVAGEVLGTAEEEVGIVVVAAAGTVVEAAEMTAGTGFGPNPRTQRRSAAVLGHWRARL